MDLGEGTALPDASVDGAARSAMVWGPGETTVWGPWGDGPHGGGLGDGLGAVAGATLGGWESMTVDIGGHRYSVVETLDLDHDGRPETGVFTDQDGLRLATSDVDHDGAADHAALLDAAGRVVDTVHRDGTSGLWVEDMTALSRLFPDVGARLGSEPHRGPP
jgi:hypothetical protein